jgi:hypothetical protein
LCYIAACPIFGTACLVGTLGCTYEAYNRGRWKGSRVSFPSPSCFTRDPPAPPCGTLFGLFYFFPVFRAFVPLAVFVLVNHHFPVVLGESTCRKWSESTKGKTWSGSELGRAGDGARELLPWTAWCSRTMCLAGERTALVLALGASSAPTADPPRSLLPACSP